MTLYNDPSECIRRIELNTRSLTTLISGGSIVLPSGQILVGQVGGGASPVTPSGDLTVSNAGVFTIGSSKIIDLIRRGDFHRMPTNGGWQTGHVNAGATGIFRQDQILLVTGADTANQKTALVYNYSTGAHPVGRSDTAVNWDKQVIYYVKFAWTNDITDTARVGRIQLKTVTTEGQLGAKGIGLVIAGMDVKGECYGSAARGETASLGTISAIDIMCECLIVNNPGVSVDFYFNQTAGGALPTTPTASLTTANTLPSGVVVTRPVFSLISANPNSASEQLIVSAPSIWVSRA